jgi:succinate dehydrogenase flavin-adding protein (antitoxin of CptAB toxin-antitoxin module)
MIKRLRSYQVLLDETDMELLKELTNQPQSKEALRVAVETYLEIQK